MTSHLKIPGFVLVTLAFVGGAFCTVLDETQVLWIPFAMVTAVGILGVGLIRYTDKQHSQTEHIVGANMETVRQRLDHLVSNITQLSEDKTSIYTYDIHPRIDELFTDDLTALVEARKAIAYHYGLQAYADIMSSFAAAERYLNRCWSASADGYVDEVHTYLERAAAQFQESQAKIRNLD